jgi:membrane associated rhomboid family serine protease
MIPLKDNVRLARVPTITIAFIVANVVAYVLAAIHGGSLIGWPSGETIVRYSAIPYEFSHWGQHCALGLAGFGQAVLCTGQHGVIGHAAPQPATWETAFTAIFLHANILQLAVNMIFLGVFGASVEDRVGHRMHGWRARAEHLLDAGQANCRRAGDAARPYRRRDASQAVRSMTRL